MSTMQEAPDAAPTPSRRAFLKLSVAASGGLLIGFHLPVAVGAETKADPALDPNAFIQIDTDGTVTLTMPQQEMGQGVYTSLSQLIAEELDVSFDRVRTQAAPPDDAVYGGPGHRQSTGGSMSIRTFYTPLRKIGASCRAMLVQAAALAWKVDPASCRTADGVVIHDAKDRRLSYGELAQRAATLTPPVDPPLKADKDFKLIGKPIRRLDTPDKVNGRAVYGIDVKLPGLKIATLAASPVVGGKILRVDDSKAKRVTGVRKVIVLEDLVAVVGDHMWAAKQGLAALDIIWDGGSNATTDSEQLQRELRAAAEKNGAVGKDEGAADQALSQGEILHAAYETAFLAHAAMEPLNCTVHITPGKCEIWTGTQVQTGARSAAAGVLGLSPRDVTLHNYMLGGAFGRRLHTDMVVRAVSIARHVDGPVKVVWTREEDMQQDMYHPAYRNVMSARLSGDKVVALKHRVAGGSVLAGILRRPLENGLDPVSLDGALEIPYDIPNHRVEYVQAEPRVLRLGWWRGVAPNNSIFAIESFIDELARKANKDPVSFRLGLLGKAPRLQAALRLAAAQSKWGGSLPPRVGRGVCAQYVFGTYLATVAEVEVDSSGDVYLRRCVAAVDAGKIVNPDTVAAQIQGGLVFGLTAALFGEVTVARGRVQQGNFNDYRVLRINEAPRIEVHLIKSDEDPGGIGEPGCTAAAPALVNAIAAATGVRLRRLPIDRSLLTSKKNP